ncbi:MAG TPA: trypsin-like peptidase domain-containing protein [Gallionellaceae bacterium]
MQHHLSLKPLVFALFALLLVNVPGARPALAAEISKSTIESVGSATFEVVVLKPTEDHLSYERPLPLDLIPFSTRNDPYYSVGTAFAIGPNQWITAGHVFDLGHKSLHKTYRLRDHAGKVYDIDQIQKYSVHRDFVVFSIKNPPHIKPLATNTAPSINEKVYSVGNALGQGVVFRDGLYTSATPEEQNGEWKWMRFSAAASPGNSGGPLLDVKGRVIGVVIGKSENENLNFALPIKEVLNAPDKVADIDARMTYRIDNMPNLSSTDRLRKKFPLPKPYAELDEQLTAEYFNFGVKLQNDFFAREKDHLFPSGKESLPLLYSDYNSVMLGLVAKGEDGMWDSYTPRKTSTNEISENGSLTYGGFGSSDMLLFHKPDGMQTSTLFKDSKQLMDAMLKGYPLYRTVASEKIRITSMGKAAQEYTHTDRYGRKWLVRLWNIDYGDRQLVLFALPVPGGFAGMLRIESAGQMPSHLEDLKVLADFACVSYYGTLADWRELLAQRDLLPQAFADIRIDFDYGKSFHYASKRLDFSYGPAEMNITEKSDLKLKFSYFQENGKTVWDVNQVIAGDNKDTSTFFTVVRRMQPAKQLDDKFQSEWLKITQRQHPFNKQAFFDNKRTIIGDIYSRDLAANQLSGAPILYTAFYSAEGNLEQKMVQTKLDHFMEKLKVRESLP